MRQPQNQQKTNHQSHQISPSIFGRLGYFKRPSFANAWFEDACAVWLHSSATLGSAGLGEAFGCHEWIVFCGGMVCYRILTLFILIPLLRGFYFSENILSDVHTRRCLALPYVFGPWCTATLRKNNFPAKYDNSFFFVAIFFVSCVCAPASSNIP